MPAHRSSKSRCAFASPPPAKKPRAPRKVVSAEEKTANALVREKKKAWEATLVPPKADPGFTWPQGTVGMFPSDAKTAFKLTPKEIDTLRREEIQGSRKSFVSLADVKNLARRKHLALHGKDVEYVPPSDWQVSTHTRQNDSTR
ncbi:hypothetical protein EXIGLDRAFT_725383, partial [Exidia glandulosa HHB12029]